MNTDIWSVAEAKAKFSKLIDRAQLHGPQTITRSGKTAAIVVSLQEWEKKIKRAGNLADFFAASPLAGSDVEIERPKGLTRPLDL